MRNGKVSGTGVKSPVCIILPVTPPSGCCVSTLLDSIAIRFPCHNGGQWVGGWLTLHCIDTVWRNNAVYSSCITEFGGVKYVMILWE